MPLKQKHYYDANEPTKATEANCDSANREHYTLLATRLCKAL